jgi:hypothetical protein
MAMANPRLPQIDQDFYYDSMSDLSPVTPASPNVVPVGTVASRIIELQNLAKSSTTSGPRSPIIRREESSRTGFGRRARPRFGQPASRSSKPDEEVQVEPEHSFLGLNKHRVNHMEEHALVNGRTKWDRTAGLHAQLQLKGLGTRVQYEATSPWRFLPRSKSFKELQQSYSQHGKAIVVESNSGMHPTSQMAISLPSDYCHIERSSNIPEKRSRQTRDESKRRTALRQEKATSPCEWISAETTSTMCRQSVKDLYYHYGIQRPAGLVSSENVAFEPEETPRPSLQQRHCHMCSWDNSPGTKKCICGHILCKQCDHISSEAIAKSVGSADSGGHIAKDDDRHILEDTQRSQSSDRGRPKQVHQEHQNQKHNVKEKFSQEGAGQCDAAVAQNVVELSSCPIVDALSSTYSLGLLPVAMRVGGAHSQHSARGDHRRPRRSHCHSGSDSVSSSEIDGESESRGCDRSECRATKQDHVPYHYDFSSTRRQRRYPEETDSGYTASASHLDELDLMHQKDKPNSRIESREHIHHTHNEERLSLHNGTANFSRSIISCHRVGETTHQKSDEEHIIAPQSEVNRRDEVKYDHEQLHPTDREDYASTRNTSLPENVYSYDQARGEGSGFGSRLESPSLKQSALPKLSLPHLAGQSVTTVMAPKPHTQVNSPDWLTDDVAISSQSMQMKETARSVDSESKPGGSNVPCDKSEQEILGSPVSPSIEKKHHAGLQADLCAETVPSSQPSGDLSPRKFQQASRRLSAFFKLQEQNIVSLLNKRLQEYQEELKRIERIENAQVNVAVERISLDQERDIKMGREKLKLDEISRPKDTEHDLATSMRLWQRKD